MIAQTKKKVTKVPTRRIVKDDVANLVGRKLNNTMRGKVKWKVLQDNIRKERTWWYIPVQPQSRVKNMYSYYDALARIELGLRDKEHLKVFLMPILPD